jgi:glycosyltransferase involved in cell wall biosynthesis
MRAGLQRMRRRRLTKVAFWFDAPIEYSGGLNYIKNLLYAVSLVNDGKVQPYVFFPHNMPDSVEKEFAQYATVVRTRLLERGSVPWFFHRVLYRLLSSMAMTTALLKRYKIDVVSHVWFVYEGKVPFRLISWIPDFQYLHMPELFPTLDPQEETRRYQAIIAQSDANILSSFNALEDFKRIAPAAAVERAKVIQFVSQPRAASATSTVSLEGLRAKYGFTGKYFFLPNQFWAHKNHLLVLQALKRLKEQGEEVLVICTGTLVDYRIKNTPYVDSIQAYIAEHCLQDNIRILGLIDYDEVLFLMKHAVAVLNPSRFEGWSSSVEEAKSAGKPVLLSRIDVHVEQAPAHGAYFDPDDADGLASLMAEAWQGNDGAPDDAAFAAAQGALQARTVAYGRSYLDLLDDVVHGRQFSK